MRQKKIIFLICLLFLTIISENIYLRVITLALSVGIIFISIFKGVNSKSHPESLWKTLWDRYCVSGFSPIKSYVGKASFDGVGFNVSISEMEEGILIERTWLPDIIAEKRESGSLILIPWKDVSFPKVIPLSSTSFLLTFQLTGNHPVKLTWISDSLPKELK